MKGNCCQNNKIKDQFVVCVHLFLSILHHPRHPLVWQAAWFTVKLDVYEFGTKLELSALLVVVEKCFLKKMKCSFPSAVDQI